ncbi:MAG: hypothetical protein LBT47_03370 [Deltaproteobacteria bacterium]|jgi:hypothetical protein|nr:hypothetical protein [Deltaproteobacteria bacterium]
MKNIRMIITLSAVILACLSLSACAIVPGPAKRSRSNKGIHVSYGRIVSAEGTTFTLETNGFKYGSKASLEVPIFKAIPIILNVDITFPMIGRQGITGGVTGLSYSISPDFDMVFQGNKRDFLHTVVQTPPYEKTNRLTIFYAADNNVSILINGYLHNVTKVKDEDFKGDLAMSFGVLGSPGEKQLATFSNITYQMGEDAYTMYRDILAQSETKIAELKRIQDAEARRVEEQRRTRESQQSSMSSNDAVASVAAGYQAVNAIFNAFFASTAHYSNSSGGSGDYSSASSSDYDSAAGYSAVLSCSNGFVVSSKQDTASMKCDSSESKDACLKRFSKSMNDQHGGLMSICSKVNKSGYTFGDEFYLKRD